MKYIAVLAIMAAMMAGIGAAHADTPDNQFVNTVGALGIPGDPAALIADGHAACDSYGGPAMVGLAMNLRARGLDATQASNLITTGLRVYCPEKIGGR